MAASEWSTEKVSMLRGLVERGAKWTEAAEVLGCSHDAARNKWNRLRAQELAEAQSLQWSLDGRLARITGHSDKRINTVEELIEHAEIDSDWDDNWYQTAMRASVRTESGAAYEVSGKVMSLIPLRNRRTTPEGDELLTRITEGMTEFTCDGQTGYGLSEYLDQIVDGKPVSLAS